MSSFCSNCDEVICICESPYPRYEVIRGEVFMDCINKNVDGKWICSCGFVSKDIDEATEHTSLFDNTPNAVRLYEALRTIYSSDRSMQDADE